MMDLVTSPASLASLSGSLQRAAVGGLVLFGVLAAASGVAVYRAVCSARATRWLAVELTGAYDPSAGSVRVRLGDGTDLWYFDGKATKKVSDPSSWDAEYMPPYMIGDMSGWAGPVAELHVMVIRVPGRDQDPMLGDAVFLLDIPAWEGSTAEAARKATEAVSEVRPVLIHTETVPTGGARSWKLGEPYSERHFKLTALEAVTVDGRVHPATLSGGTVALTGQPAPAGSQVRVAVRYAPNTSVKRAMGVDTVDTVPAWWVQNMVVQGGLNGSGPPMMVGGYDVRYRRTELRLTVNGVADRTADALAMRAALEEALGSGLCIGLSSGREVLGQLSGVVEVIHRSSDNLPMATCVLAIAMSEVASARLVRTQRDTDGNYLGSTITMTTGDPASPGPTVASDLDTLSGCA